MLRPWLRLNVTEYLFQPCEAEATRDQERRQKRKTPMTPSQARRCRKSHPRRRPGTRYTPSSYAAAVATGVEAANKARLDRGPCRDEDLVLHFTPNMLRHAKATQIRGEAGLDAARAVLGHRTPVVTEVYAELDEAKAAEIMARLG